MTGRTLVAALLAVVAALSACAEPDRAYVREGNADSVTISHQSNVASTIPLARKHCAQFERVPQLVESSTDLATYDCRRR